MGVSRIMYIKLNEELQRQQFPISLDNTFLLLTVMGKPECNQQYIADIMLKHKSVVLRSIDELEALDLLERKADTIDRRKNLISLLPEGTALVYRFLKIEAEIVQKLTQDFPSSDIEQLRHTLTEIRLNAETI